MNDSFRSIRIQAWFITGILPVLALLAGCKPETTNIEKPFARLLENQSFQSRVLNRTVNYAVLLPQEYEKPGDSYPVVYLLHGLGENETGWYKWGLIKYYADRNAAITVPMIYVMPDGFNTYWVNRYNGNFPYMDAFVRELVPTIDSLFRTIRDPQHRAVMGYSMGGFGAMILPAKNPDVFKTGVALSMSYRTDQQYIDEPRDVFDWQWGSVFGGTGTTGQARLTDYYKECSPLHFFLKPGDMSRTGQNYFFDCGEDEENLAEPNNALHTLLRDLDIRHEYRMKEGAHNWDYWHKALPEALKYIGFAVRNITYPDDPEPVDTSQAVPAARIAEIRLTGSEAACRILLPEDYAADTVTYPLIAVIHQRSTINPEESSQALFSLLNAHMIGKRIPVSLVLEIPVQQEKITTESLREIIAEVSSAYRTCGGREHSILLGNRLGGRMVYELVPGCAGLFSACLLFDADLPSDPDTIAPEMNYYLDICDEGVNYSSYHSLFMNLRKAGISHEYRVRQGTDTHDSFLDGLDRSSAFMKIYL